MHESDVATFIVFSIVHKSEKHFLLPSVRMNESLQAMSMRKFSIKYSSLNLSPAVKGNIKLWKHRASSGASSIRLDPIGSIVYRVTLGSGTDFGASQCISMGWWRLTRLLTLGVFLPLPRESFTRWLIEARERKVWEKCFWALPPLSAKSSNEFDVCS